MVNKFKKTMILMAVLVVSFFCSKNFEVSKPMGLMPNVEQHQILGDNSEPSVSVLTDFEKGDVSGAGRYPVGEQVVLSATAKDGCEFVEWQIKNADETYTSVSTEAVFSFVMDNSDVTYRAVFDYAKYSITTSITDYFDMTDFSYQYDSERFDESSVANYPRATVDNALSDGKVYYNDIVTLQFAQTNNVFVKKIASNNLYSNTKPIAIIDVGTDGTLLSTKIGGVEKQYGNCLLTEAIADETIIFDYDSYTYFILTQQNVGDNYVTKNIELRYKVKANSNFNLNTTQLYLFTISAIDATNTPINVAEKLSDLITFDYGYYGEYDLSGESWKFLIENGANYSVSFYSNQFYAYNSVKLQGNGIVGLEKNDTALRGYFNPQYDELIATFSQTNYRISFQELLRKNSKNVAMTTKWNIIPSQSVLPGHSITVDIENGVLLVDGDADEAITFEQNTVYGYRLFAMSTDKDCASADTSNTTFIIDDKSPENLTIYLIYQEIDYTVHVDVLDKSGNQNQYLKGKINYLSQNGQTIHAKDTFTLAGIAQSGFKLLGWKQLNGELSDTNRQQLLENEYIANKSFTFTPVSNVETDLYFYLFVDYDTRTINYSLDSVNSWWQEESTTIPMATLSLAIIDYFQLADATLSVYGRTVLGNSISASQELLSLQLVNPVTSGNNYIYASIIGDIEIVKDEEEYISLSFASHKYIYADGKFSRDMSVAVEYQNECNYNAGEKLYSYTLNISCDDVILCLSENVDNTKYKFNYYTITGTSTLLSYSLEANKYAHIYSTFGDANLKVVYSLKTSKITVAISGDGYDLEDVDIEIDGGKTGIDVNGAFIEMNVEVDQQVSITILNGKMKQGYKYASTKTNYSELNPAGINAPRMIASGNNFVMTFKMTSEYAGLEVVINIAEIDYIVRLIDVNGYGLEAQFASFGETFESVENGEFIVNWTRSKYQPKLQLKSANGYYISNAYFMIEDGDHIVNALIGDTNSQTDKQFEINDFEKYIINNAEDEVSASGDITKVVKLFVYQTERTYFVTFIYRLNDDGKVSNTQKGAITSSYHQNNALADATQTASLVGTSYMVKFENIAYGSVTTFTMNDEAVSGMKFVAWATEKEDHSLREENTSTTITLTVDKNLEYYVIFQRLEYTIEFRYGYLNEDNLFVEYSLPVANVAIDGISDNKFKVGDKFSFAISSRIGYKFDKLNYGYLVDANLSGDFSKLVYIYTTEYSYSSGIEAKGNGVFDVDVSTNTNNITGFNAIYTFKPEWNTRNNQKTNSNYRRWVINLVFDVKYYNIQAQVANLTEAGNTTGRELDNWVQDLTIMHGNSIDGDYQENATGDYAIGDYIKITFNQSFYGITFKNVSFIENAVGEGKFYLAFDSADKRHEVANQTMYFEWDNTENVYILRFQLNETLLADLDEQDSLFNVYLRYEIRSYVINFSAIYLNKLIEDYGINLAYNYGIVGDTTENKSNFNTVQYYGTDMNCTVILGAVTKNFNGKYYFEYFKVGNKKLLEHTSEDEIELEYVLDFASNNIWQLIEDTTETVKIVAYFSPRISLYNFRKNNSEGIISYTRESTYSGAEQKLTTIESESFESEYPDVVYDKDEFAGMVIITYTCDDEVQSPKDAGVYLVTIRIAGVYTFPHEIWLTIHRAKVELNYKGAVVSKEYDGTNAISSANLNYFKASFGLTGLQGNDGTVNLLFDFKNLVGEFDDKSVAERKTVNLSNICLSDTLRKNYEFVTMIDEANYYMTNITLKNQGRITPKTVTIDKGLFVFNDIVYKDNEDYVLKYTINYDREVGGEKVIQDDRLMISGRVGNDEVYIAYDQDISALGMVLNDYSVGYNRKVTISGDTALVGADSGNYVLVPLEYTIDIYPYKLTYTKENVGIFEICDKSEQCLIPIDLYGYESFEVEYINSSTIGYPELYSILESHVARDEKIHSFYKVNLYSSRGERIEVKDILKGCYLRIPEVSDTKTIYGILESDVADVNYNSRDSKIEILIGDDTRSTLGLVVDKSYFAIWKIILIIGLILLFILIIIIIILIIKRKNEKENEKKHKI